MAKEGSVAPRERVNIVYKPATGDAQEEKKLPFKMIVMGDFTGRADDRPLEDRKPVSADKDNFNDVMRSMKLNPTFSTPNTISGKEGAERAAKVRSKRLKDK